MPLILMCGFPSSGKSKRANELEKYFSNECQKKVTVISDHTIGVNRNETYDDSKKEKIVRGNLKSSVQRCLDKDSITILDSLNYIKGFRYELYCVTKESQTTQCLIHCNTDSVTASQWNLQRDPSEQYSQEIFDGLVMRFEEPNGSNRWDSPLFIVQKDDTLPLEAISDTLLKRKPPPQNASTLPQPLSSTNFLYELDRVTTEIVQVIIAALKTFVPGDKINIPSSTDKLNLCRPFTLAELQRSRRQFITYTKMHPVDDISKIGNMFVQYLNNTLK
ncbi:protein KTI12 homolog [Ruditapes philippinarum]|uniref:protein KTI12 homolog n=1 Tax=Ruditapes philippinarum TaxID=129788 RepID=UPI00295AFFC1|nr:protein KTI12 homolog [Ruditapes philippinarum]